MTYEFANIIECWVVLLNKKHFSNFADIAGLFSLIIVQKVILVSLLFFMFVNILVAFWIKLFDSTDTNFPSGFANVGYMAIGAIHAQSGVDAWSVRGLLVSDRDKLEWIYWWDRGP